MSKVNKSGNTLFVTFAVITQDDFVEAQIAQSPDFECEEWRWIPRS
jgi:hypothetical protein